MRKRILNPNTKVSQKINQAFHTLFFDNKVDFANASLEVIVEENIQTKGVEYSHTFSTRGNYMKPKRSRAFARVEDAVVWEYVQSLASDYATQIAKGLDKRVYSYEQKDSTLSIRPKASREKIIGAIGNYVSGKGGNLSQAQFTELTGASEFELCQMFGCQHDTVSRRVYSANDILRFSQKYFIYSVPKTFHTPKGIKSGWEKRCNHLANIMNIYTKILDYDAPKGAVQGTLF